MEHISNVFKRLGRNMVLWHLSSDFRPVLNDLYFALIFTVNGKWSVRLIFNNINLKFFDKKNWIN